MKRFVVFSFCLAFRFANAGKSPGSNMPCEASELRKESLTISVTNKVVLIVLPHCIPRSRLGSRGQLFGNHLQIQSRVPCLFPVDDSFRAITNQIAGELA